MLRYWTCFSIMHVFQQEFLCACATDSNTDLKYNVKNFGWVVKLPAVSFHLACAVLEWTILLHYARPGIKLHFKGSILLLLK